MTKRTSAPDNPGSGLSIAILATSQSPDSVSTSLARSVARFLEAEGVAVDFVDTARMPRTYVTDPVMPPSWQRAADVVRAADGVYIGGGVFGWTPAASMKVAVENLGDAFTGKPTAFGMACGSNRAFMAHMSLVQSLGLERHIHWFPRHLVVDGTTRDAPETLERVAQVMSGFLDFVRRLARAA